MIRRRLGLMAAACALGGLLAASPASATLVQIDPANNKIVCASGCASPTVPANFSTAQVACATTATQVVALRTARALQSVVNTTTTPIYLGGSGVTTSTGHLLPGVVGASLTLPFTGALYCVVASGTATVTEAETF